MNKDVVIIGGGIIGLSSAYYLQKEGHKVTVIDQSDITSGASFVNAGYVSPSHFVPLAAPGMINKGIKWMFHKSSPFYIKPRVDIDLIKWGLNFKKSATQEKVDKAIPILKDFNIFSKELYEEIRASNEFDFFYKKKGLIMLYQTDKGGEEEWKLAQRAIKEGLKAKILSIEDVKKLEPKVDLNIKGAIFYDGDSHMTPDEYMKGLYSYLKKIGIKFHTNEKVLQLENNNNKILKIITNKRDLAANEVVLATGSWSPLLTKKLNLKIPVQAGKGYRINVKRETGITMPAILVEAKVGVTPMNGFTRFAGTMEIGGINNNIDYTRVKSIVKLAESFYKNLKISKTDIDNAACGLRPCTPDGLPFIGRHSKFKNLTIATGHAMMGWSMGPGTGKLISEIISDKKLSLDLNPFSVQRFG